MDWKIKQKLVILPVIQRSNNFALSYDVGPKWSKEFASIQFKLCFGVVSRVWAVYKKWNEDKYLRLKNISYLLHLALFLWSTITVPDFPGYVHTKIIIVSFWDGFIQPDWRSQLLGGGRILLNFFYLISIVQNMDFGLRSKKGGKKEGWASLLKTNWWLPG